MACAGKAQDERMDKDCTPDVLKNNICGWELNNPDGELFDVRTLEVSGECKSCEHVKKCPVASQAVRCLIPRQGELVELDRALSGNGEMVTYFALIHEPGMRFIQLREQEYYWARASYVVQEDLPERVLSVLQARLNEAGVDLRMGHGVAD